MATRTWAGGTANWSATAAWVEAAVPTAADDVLIGASGHTTGTLTVDGTSGSPSLCRSMDCTSFTGTLTMGATSVLSVGDGTTGICKFVSGMTCAPASGALIKFVSTSGSNCLITTGTKALRNLTFDGVGGKWQFQDACNNAASSTITLTNGTLDTNGQTIGATNGAILSSSNSNTRALTLGATTWSLPNAGTWDIGTSTGMTLSAASSTINYISGSNSARIFNGGGLTYGTYAHVGSNNVLNLNQANTFATLNLGTSVIAQAVLAGNQTVTGTYTHSGLATTRALVNSDTIGTARTITAGTVTVDAINFRDITGAGAGSWNVSAVTNGSGDGGGNTGITFAAPKNCFMKTAVSVSWSASNWFTASGGSTPIGSGGVPLIHDTAVFDANSVTATLKTITNDQGAPAAGSAEGPGLPTMAWTGVLNTPAFASGSTISTSYGGITFVSGMTHTGTGAFKFRGRGANTLNGGTLTWPASSTITVDTSAGSLTLAAAFASSAGIIILSGTLANGGFAPTFTTLTVTGGAWSGNGAITGTTCTVNGGALTLGSTLTLTGALAVSSGTLDMNANNITGHTTTAISSAGLLNLSGQSNGSGAMTVTGGTVADTGASGELKGTTISVSGGTATMRKLTCSSTWNMTGGTTTISASGSASYSAFPTLSSPGIFKTGGAISTMTDLALTVAASSGGGGMLYIQALDGA